MTKGKKKISLADSIDALISSTRPSYHDPEEGDIDDTKAKSHDYDDSDDDRIDGSAGIVGRSTLRARAGMEFDESSEDETYKGKPVSTKELYSVKDEEGMEMDGEENDDSEVEINNRKFGSCDDADDASTEDDGEGDGEVPVDDADVTETEDEDEEAVMNSELKLIASKGSDAGGEKRSSGSDESTVTKAVHAQRQQHLWSDLLESRILMQSVMSISNTLPQSSSFATFAADKEIKQAYGAAYDELLPVLEDFFTIRDCAIASNPTLSKAIDAAVSEGLAPASLASRKRKRGSGVTLSELWSDIDGGSDRMAPYVDAVLNRWNDRVQLAAGKTNVKKFKALNQGVVAQVDLAMADPKRVDRKAHTKRSNYAVIGGSPSLAASVAPPGDGSHTALDYEIYDDADFYHQLLKQLLLQASGGSDSMKDGAALQFKYPRLKRRGHTKSSKGRRLKYTVQPKIVNFLAPENSSVAASASASDDLLISLFGKSTTM